MTVRRPVLLEQAADALDPKHRRNHFRVRAALAMSFSVLDAAGQPIARQSGKAVTRNLSAGGLAFTTRDAPPVAGQRLRVRLDVPRALQVFPGETIDADARVIRVWRTMENGRPRDAVALQLLFRVESERDRWVRLSFQLELRTPR